LPREYAHFSSIFIAREALFSSSIHTRAEFLGALNNKDKYRKTPPPPSSSSEALYKIGAKGLCIVSFHNKIYLISQNSILSSHSRNLSFFILFFFLSAKEASFLSQSGFFSQAAPLCLPSNEEDGIALPMILPLMCVFSSVIVVGPKKKKKTACVSVRYFQHRQ
jgi:hypothetical protein